MLLPLCAGRDPFQPGDSVMGSCTGLSEFHVTVVFSYERCNSKVLRKRMIND